METTTRELLYSKLLTLQTYMLGFGISREAVRNLIIKFSESYGLSQNQVIQLIQKIADFGKDEVVLMD